MATFRRESRFNLIRCSAEERCRRSRGWFPDGDLTQRLAHAIGRGSCQSTFGGHAVGGDVRIATSAFCANVERAAEELSERSMGCAVTENVDAAAAPAQAWCGL